MTPVQALTATRDALKAGEVVPPEAAAFVAAGLSAYLQGRADLPACLGLKPRKGERSSLTVALLDDRNTLIKAVFASLTGDRNTRAKKTGEILAGPPTDWALEITEADVINDLIEWQRAHGGDLPRSRSQILKIVGKP